ncbi:MAG: folate-binding protein YgfZ [Rhodospirillales bacterium]|nr:folate-binding protein YgfZ [Rhodospirillales bacterium]
MTGLKGCRLSDRGMVAVGGTDARDFLQGIVSNDLRKVAPDRALWAALLTPQGKYLFDFFIGQQGERLLLETEATRLPELLRRLKLYKLRSKVTLEDETAAWHAFAAWGPASAALHGLKAKAGSLVPVEDGAVLVDPRHAGLGLRFWSRGDSMPAGIEEVPREDYDRIRIGLGLPDGSRDMEVDKAILLENGFDELGGVDWHKGCYMGQELTARTKYRGLVKKRLLPIKIEGSWPDGVEEIVQDGRQVGSLRSRVPGHGLALLRLECLDRSAPLTLGGQAVRALVPDWVILPNRGQEARQWPRG